MTWPYNIALKIKHVWWSETTVGLSSVEKIAHFNNKKWNRNKNLKRWCYLQWLHTWQQWQVHCFVLRSSLAWNFWFQACVIWWRTISDPTEMVLLSVHVLAALYAWANEATNPKKKWSIIYNSVINSFAKLDYCRKFFLS